jgi:hypothetical protein
LIDSKSAIYDDTKKATFESVETNRRVADSFDGFAMFGAIGQMIRQDFDGHDAIESRAPHAPERQWIPVRWILCEGMTEVKFCEIVS